MRARVAPKFVDATAALRARGFTVEDVDTDASAMPDIIWDNASTIDFAALPPSTFVNHLARTGEFGHKASTSIFT